MKLKQTLLPYLAGIGMAFKNWGSALKSKPQEDKPRVSNEWAWLIAIIMFQLCMAAAIGMMLRLMLLKMDLALALWPALLLGAGVWASVLFFTDLISSFFMMVPPNHGAVLANIFRRYEKPTNDETKLKNTRTLREVGPGLQGKLPWERPISLDGTSKFINLQRQIAAGSSVKVMTAENYIYTVTFQVFLTALRGYLCNLVRFDIESSRSYFQGMYSGYLIRTIKTMDNATFIAAINPDPDINRKDKEFKHGPLEKGFNELFGGEGKQTPTEQQRGLFTNDPVISSIVPDQQTEDILAAGIKAKTFNDTLKTVIGDTGMSPEFAGQIAASLQGTNVSATYTNLHITGLGGVEGKDKTRVLAHLANLGGNTSKKQKK